MKQKNGISPALWFIPLVAVILALLCVLLFLIGKNLLFKPSVPKVQPVQQSNAAPVIPSQAGNLSTDILEDPLEGTEEVPVDETSAAQPEVCPAPAVPVKLSKPRSKVFYTPYQQGLNQCKQGGIFPCAWADDLRGTRIQYWLMSAEGPIQRGVYDAGGKLLTETIATIGGTVTSYTENDATWYFQAGVLVKIRTSPYDNCNLHDWFFVNEQGQQDVCQCAYTTPDCCARSPYRPDQGRSYCDLFPLDRDFCSNP